VLGTELGVGKRLQVDQAMQGIPYWALISTNSLQDHSREVGLSLGGSLGGWWTGVVGTEVGVGGRLGGWTRL